MIRFCIYSVFQFTSLLEIGGQVTAIRHWAYDSQFMSAIDFCITPFPSVLRSAGPGPIAPINSWLYQDLKTKTNQSLMGISLFLAFAAAAKMAVRFCSTNLFQFNSTHRR